MGAFRPLESLNPCSWKGIEFPITMMRTQLKHDIAQHKTWGVDGARLEATGRAPLTFHANIPFINHISPGKNESWEFLYPQTYRKFLAQSAVGTSGILVHPELGPIKCKLDSCDTTWSGVRRGGVDVDASWTEDIDDDKTEDVFSKASPLAEAGQVMLALKETEDTFDGFKTVAAATSTNNRVVLPDYPKRKTSLADDLRKISGAINAIGLEGGRVFAHIDALIYRVNAIEQAAKRSTDVFTIGVIQNTQRAKDALRRLKKDILNKQRKTVIFVVRKPMTLAAIANATGDSVSDIAQLNPRIMSYPVVPKDTYIRYYTNAS